MKDNLDRFKKSLSVFCDIGNYRSANEDRYIIKKILDSNEDGPVIFVGVFDGHGGEKCAKYLANYFPDVLENNINQLTNIEVLKNSITKSCHQINQDFLNNNKHAIDGSCGLMGLIFKPKKDKYFLLTANVGDSKGILAKKPRFRKIVPVKLNKIHKPNDPAEREYIERHGGTVIGGRIFGLAVSRAFGNRDIIGNGLRCDPDFEVIKLSKSDIFFIYASDGLWDVVSEEEAVEFVIENQLTDDIAKKLGNYALNKGSTDNVTVIVGNVEYLTK